MVVSGMETQNTYRIRPAGRHILTIGRELIQDRFAAVVELVKNAFDADASRVTVDITQDVGSGRVIVSIADDGHGMTFDTVAGKWLVPSTPDKLKRGKSPNGRTMQGRKGVGRYAASILGKDLLLETSDQDGELTRTLLNWEDFEQAEFLDQVNVLLEREPSDWDHPGTRMVIEGDSVDEYFWDQSQVDKLRFELKKLMSPVSGGDEKAEFSIELKTHGVDGVENKTELIEPYPIFDLYEYRISGEISSNGTGLLTYYSQNKDEEKISFDLKEETGCGSLSIDVRVFDRDKDAIDRLIARGLKDESGNYVGKLQARNLLNHSNGIGVYRNGFRIRPLGDADFDWLTLNERRVQNPSLRIGSNQVIGYVGIQSEEHSGLAEKSARDGLKNNKNFSQLKKITSDVIGLLEQRRYVERRSADNKGRNKIDDKMSSLSDATKLKSRVKKVLSGKVPENLFDEVLKEIEKDAFDREVSVNGDSGKS